MDTQTLEATPEETRDEEQAMNPKKIALAAGIGGLICLYIFADGQKYLNVDIYQNLFATAPWLTAGVYFLLIVLGTGFSLPVTAIMMVGSGMIFGTGVGLAIALTALTLGGTMSLLTGRFLFNDVVERRFTGYLEIVNKGIDKEGIFYLFSLRLIPIFPFWVINLLLGITRVRIPVFMLTTFCGMAPVTAIFCFAGSQLGSIEELNIASILTPGLILALCLLAGFPFVAKALLTLTRRMLGKAPAE